MKLYFDDLPGDLFEEYLLRIFQMLGYSGMVTQSSGDFGADLFISNSDEKIVVQAKRYSDAVGIFAVQEIIGAKQYYNADRCMVVTTNQFTPSAIELAQANKVELWDRATLIQMIVRSFGNGASIKPFPQPTPRTPRQTDFSGLAPLMPEALNVILKYGASVSSLQRYQRIGYSCAARIMDYMEHLGVVSRFSGLFKRTILMNKSEAYSKYPEIFNK